MFENEFIKTALILLGVSESAFSVADPMTLFFMFIFSTRILTFILAVVIWGAIFVVRIYRGGGIQEHKTTRDVDSMIHRYDMTKVQDMKRMYKMDKTPSLLGVLFKGFIFPVAVIFIALSIAMSMVNA